MPVRLTLLALVGGLTLALNACCSERWGMTEEGEAALARARSETLDLSLSYDACALPDSVVHLLDRARLILADEERAFVDYQTRIDKALTPGERDALTERREVLLEGMLSQVDQLRTIVNQGTDAGASSIAIVFTSVEVTAAAPVPVIQAKFDYVSAASPGQRPAGITVRDVSARHALSALLDHMERFASAQDVLSIETRAKLAEH